VSLVPLVRRALDPQELPQQYLVPPGQRVQLGPRDQVAQVPLASEGQLDKQDPLDPPVTLVLVASQVPLAVQVSQVPQVPQAHLVPRVSRVQQAPLDTPGPQA